MKMLEKKKWKKILDKQLIQIYSFLEGQIVVSFSLNDGNQFPVGNRTFCYIQVTGEEAIGLME